MPLPILLRYTISGGIKQVMGLFAPKDNNLSITPPLVVGGNMVA
jgi:hypothetical protein